MKNTVNFYYHLNCQHINDKEGDIKLCVTESCQNIEYSFYLFKFEVFKVKEQDLNLIQL